MTLSRTVRCIGPAQLPNEIELLVSWSGVGCYGSVQGPGGWGLQVMHYGFEYGGMLMWTILLIYFFVQFQKTKGQTPTHKMKSHPDILKKRYAEGKSKKKIMTGWTG
ncbi:MAG: hypothetical protein MZV70_64780 [Desulfobacterales bacterium]|nr:hypothetical protein [Desulfobacterales bacterium]